MLLTCILALKGATPVGPNNGVLVSIGSPAICRQSKQYTRRDTAMSKLLAATL